MARLLGLCGFPAIATVCALLPAACSDATVLSAACGDPDEHGSCPAEAEPLQGSALFQSRLRLGRLRQTGDKSLHDTAFQVLEQALDSHDAGRCDLCAQDWVIILATGRSGSTSVLQMLNALPGFFVAGEHAGVITNLMGFWRDVFSSKRPEMNPSAAFGADEEPPSDITDYKDRTGSIGAWFHGARSEGKVLCALQLAATALLGDIDASAYTTLGFKEIRYLEPEVLGFLARLFPCARFVVNVRRDLSAQAESGFWRRRGSGEEAVEEELEMGTFALKSWQTQDPSERFLLELESFSTQKFNSMLEWLGVRGCNFTQVAHANAHGSFSQVTQQAMVAGRCSMKESQSELRPGDSASHASKEGFQARGTE